LKLRFNILKILAEYISSVVDPFIAYSTRLVQTDLI